MAACMSPKNDEDIISDINVTPLVDIVLVLLIIFMVTASLIITPAIKVDLPKAANADDNPESTVALVMTKEGNLFLNGSLTSWQDMQASIRRQLAERSDLQAVISADKDVPHGEVIHLIDTIKGLGIVQFALNIERTEYQTEEG